MGFTKKQPPPEEEPGAPEWMLTFSDCMTLLLTFFVLLITFSSPGSGSISETSSAFRKIMPGLGRSDERYRNALLNILGIEYADDITTGSETPTSETKGWGNLKEDFSLKDFSKCRVFLITSEKIFWGKGESISQEGRDILRTMADLLKKVPDRVIISEGGYSNGKENDSLGLQRAWSVLEYMTESLGRDRFGVSVTGTVKRENVQANVQAKKDGDGQRMVEIVLLERSLYN